VRNEYKILIEEPEENGLLERHWRRWENNIKTDHKEEGARM
jgi:hypothetical protein